MPPAAGSFPGRPSARSPSSPPCGSERRLREPRAAARSDPGPAAPLPVRPPAPQRSLPPPAGPHCRAPSISQVRRLRSLAAVPAHAAPLPRRRGRPDFLPGLRGCPPHSPLSPWWRWLVPGAGSRRLRTREKGREQLAAGGATRELGLSRGGRGGGRPAVGPMPPLPPPGCYRCCCHVSASSRRSSAPQTPPQLQPAPPPHFLKYATCVLAPPTPRTSPLPEQPDTRRRPDPAPPQAPPPRPGARRLRLVPTPGRRAPGPGRACPRLGRPRPSRCGAHGLPGRRGLGGHGAPVPPSPRALRDRSVL